MIITYERDGCYITIAKGAQGNPGGLRIEVPEHQFVIEASPLPNGKWRHVNTVGGLRHSYGDVTWKDMISTVVPATVGDVPVLAALFEVVDGRGNLHEETGELMRRFTSIAHLVRGVEQNFTPSMAVDAMRMVAATYGYRLEPDDKLIRLAGECQAYRELQGRAFDNVFGSVSTVEGLFHIIGDSQVANERLFSKRSKK